MPSNTAALDEALARTDYAALRDLMSVETRDQAERMLAWTREAVFEGASFPLAYFYAVDLWVVAESFEARAAGGGEDAAADLETARSIKTLSVVMAIYAETLVYVDSRRCGDRSVEHQVLADLGTNLAPQWSFGASLPDDLLTRMAEQARLFEERTAPIRQPDLWLCASGRGFMRAQMKAINGAEPARRPIEDLTTPDGYTALEMGGENLVVDDGLWWARVHFARMAALRSNRFDQVTAPGR